MYKISEFAELCGVSAKLLRYYDSIGLLMPAVVAPNTGYRLYTAEQVLRFKRIALLKALGFTLRQIAHLLDSSLSADEFLTVLVRRRGEVEQRIAIEQRRLRQIEEQIAHIALHKSAVCPWLTCPSAWSAAANASVDA
jgi:DNA-binding transcriptional MerR regulator